MQIVREQWEAIAFLAILTEPASSIPQGACTVVQYLKVHIPDGMMVTVVASICYVSHHVHCHALDNSQRLSTQLCQARNGKHTILDISS